MDQKPHHDPTRQLRNEALAVLTEIAKNSVNNANERTQAASLILIHTTSPKA